MDERALLNQYMAEQNRKRSHVSSGMMMDFGGGMEDVTPYLHMKHPGTQPLKMLADPYVLYRDGDAMRKRWPYQGIPEFVWRKRTDRYTVQGVAQGWLRPVFKEDIDSSSPHAVFDEVKTFTPQGAKAQVATRGLCLYRLAPEKAAEFFKAPVDYYKGDLARMQFTETDRLRKQGYQSPDRVNGLNMQITDTKSEVAVGD